MYSLMVRRNFIAQHFLTVPGCGPENEWHSHHFQVEVLLEGRTLDENGYLVDIVAVKAGLDALVKRYDDATLNELPEFEGLNPSIEHFARFFCEGVVEKIEAARRLDTVSVRMWEDDDAWASYRMEL